MSISVPQFNIGLNTAANSPGLFVGATPDWQLAQQKVAQGDAFKDGLPRRADGSVDTDAMAATMYQKGAYDAGANLMSVGIAQKQMADAGKLTAGMASWLKPSGENAQPASSDPATPSQGAMPLFQSAVSGIESGGKYNAQGPVTKSGDRAYGKYQVMGNNIGPWTKEILGTEMTPDQFLADPKAQDAVFNGKFGQYLKQTGNPRDAASMWFTGRPYAQGADASDELGTTGAGYVDKFMTSLRSGDAARAMRASASIASAAPSADRPVQVAQNSDADTPASSHPYGPNSAAGDGATSGASPTGRSATMPLEPPRVSSSSAPVPNQTNAAGGSASATAPPAAPPVPVSFLPPPAVSPAAGTVPQPADPTYGGQVPPAWLAAGHSAADWVRYARTMATIGSANPYAKGAADQWPKIADGLETSIQKATELTPQQKDARDPLVLQNQSDLAVTKANARADAMTATAAQRAEKEQEGQALGKMPGQLATDADSARSQNSMIDEMLDASRQFAMGKFADKEQSFNSAVSAVGHKLGVDTSSIDGKVAAYEDFGKLAGQFSRQAMKEAGGRAGGIQELRFITNTLPSPTMSQAGFEAVANQLKGIGDFKVAKQQAGADWLAKNGTMQGFDETWNKNVTPGAFVMHRLQVDQPDVFAQTVNRLAQTAQGRASLQSMRSGMAWAGSSGLLD